MRPLEVAFLASLLLTGITLFIPPDRRPAALRYRPALPLTLALAHVFVEHGRWQLFAAYAIAGLVSLAAVFEVRQRSGERRNVWWLRSLGGVVVLVVTMASAAAGWLVPVFSLPEPGGPHRVGTVRLALTDSTREEELTTEAGDRRRVIVRLWYPADSVDGTPDDYVERVASDGLAAALGVPALTLSHLSLVTSHAYRRARLVATPARLPLLLFSHGYGSGTESQNTVQMEALASHGYVVASIDHPYEAAAIVLPDGRTARYRPTPAQRPDSARVARLQAIIARLRRVSDTTALAAGIAELRTLGLGDLDRSIERWTDDTRFVLDRLTAMSAPGARGDTVFSGRLATDRVGVFGMSFGGATAANFCLMDLRCAAGMNLDGLLFGAAAEQPVRAPFLVASSADNEGIHRLFHERAQTPAWLVTVGGTKHLDFTDLGWFGPAVGERLGVLGGIPPARMHALMNEVLLSWFDWVMRAGAEPRARAWRDRFPELTVRIRHRRDGLSPE